MEFGHEFYEWWAGLSRPTRLIVAGAMLGASAIGAWIFPDSWLVWAPILIAGTVMVLFELW